MRNYGIAIIFVSNMAIKSSLKFKSMEDCAFSSNEKYLFCTDDEYGLQTIDISDTKNPVEIKNRLSLHNGALKLY